MFRVCRTITASNFYLLSNAVYLAGLLYVRLAAKDANSEQKCQFLDTPRAVISCSLERRIFSFWTIVTILYLHCMEYLWSIFQNSLQNAYDELTSVMDSTTLSKHSMFIIMKNKHSHYLAEWTWFLYVHFPTLY